MKKFEICLLIVFCVSCTSVPKSGFKQNELLQQDTLKQKVESEVGNVLEGEIKIKVSKEEREQRCFSDTVIVWVFPSGAEADSIIKANAGDPNWYNPFDADDDGYYTTQAMAFILDKQMGQFLITDSAKIYTFNTEHGRFEINKNDYDTPWFIILFDGVHKPIVTAPINLEETYNNYFK